VSAPAIVAGGWIASTDGERRQLPAPLTLPAVATAAVELGAGVVFMFVDVPLAGGDGWGEPEITGGQIRRKGSPPPWRVHVKREARTVALVWPQNDEDRAGGPLRGCWGCRGRARQGRRCSR
jgi:hypothetical protein